MKIEYRYTFSTPREVVWKYLQDEEVLERSLPGCKNMQAEGDGVYLAELGLNVGPVNGLFAGQVRITDLKEPESYRLVMKGKGKPGEFNGDARIRLEESEKGTELSCEAEAQVTGVLASAGQRVMGGIAKLLLGRFFKAVEKEIQQSVPNG